MRTSQYGSGGLAFAALVFLAAVSPAFLVDFGVHNDYRIGPHAILGTLRFGHIESFHLVRIGRILNAYLYNLHWRQIHSYIDLKIWRLVSALLLVASFVGVALHLRRSATLPVRQTTFLALALFLTPPFTINCYYASLLVPGTVALSLTVATYIVQYPLLAAALESRRLPRLAIWLALTLAALIVGHFIYTPSTALFLVLAATDLLHGPASTDARRTALLELGVYLLSCALYFVLQREIVFPWASRAFAYGSRWTDPEYSFAVLPGAQSLVFFRDALRTSFNAWNSFSGFDAAWLIAIVLSVSLVGRMLVHRDRQRGRHRVFVLGFLVACFALGLAPELLSNFRWTGYRILAGPVLLVCLALVSLFLRLLPPTESASAIRRERWLLATFGGFLVCATFVAMTIAVEEARAEIGCLQDFLLEGPHVDSLLLLSEAPGGSELREEFGYRIREVGPLDEFGFQVIDDLKRRGLLPAEQAGSVGEVSREEVGRVEAIPRTAVLDVDVHSCRCVAGPPCQHMWPAQ